MSDSTKGDVPVRVLVIEDNPDDCELLLRQLRKNSASDHVKFISDGQEALDFLTRCASPSTTDKLIAVFLDLKLPRRSGLELLRFIRSRKELQDLSVIVISGSNNPKDMEECHKLKVTSYVSKPITFALFSKAVADVFHLPKV